MLMLLSNLANSVTLLMRLFEKSAETSIVSAEDSAERCGSVPFVNVRDFTLFIGHKGP
jgi:hypothetical protein